MSGDTPFPSVADTLRQLLPAVTVEAGPATDMPTIYVGREHLVDVCRVLRDDAALQFALLVDITAVDWLPAEPRFEMVYMLASLGAAYAAPSGAAPARRLRLKVRVPGHDATVPTIVPVYPAANWPEREVFDLFGITFEGHPDLRRILMTDDWVGHPLRKDYAVQIRKDTASWSPIQLSPEEFAANMRAGRERAAGEAQTNKGPGRRE
jgi:NADH-quinone oxidoreductase subunit C